MIQENNRGFFICSISPGDFRKSIEVGVYGNRFNFSKKGKELRDNDKLSIIRDLIAIKPGDIIFLHVIGEQKVYGLFEALSEPFYSEYPIWDRNEELFPCRFCFKFSDYIVEYIKKKKLPYISVNQLYEIIETKNIKSLISLEFEQNIERRSVRKILGFDASKILEGFTANMQLENLPNSIETIYKDETCQGVPLKRKIFKVGNIENAVKAVLLYQLAWKGEFFKLLFGLAIENLKYFDFANEVFISPITRKLMDIYVFAKFKNNYEKHYVIEVKTKKVEIKDLLQGISYADLLVSLGWIKNELYSREVIMIGRSFDKEVIKMSKSLNQFYSENLKIRLIQYEHVENKTWAKFKEIDLNHSTQSQLKLDF